MDDNLIHSILMMNEVAMESLVIMVQEGLITEDELKTTLNKSLGNITNRQVPEVRDSEDFGYGLSQCIEAILRDVRNEVSEREDTTTRISPLTVIVGGAIQ